MFQHHKLSTLSTKQILKQKEGVLEYVSKIKIQTKTHIFITNANTCQYRGISQNPRLQKNKPLEYLIQVKKEGREGLRYIFLAGNWC